MKKIYKLYAYLFGWPIFARFNFCLHRLSLRALGLYNHENIKSNGEGWFIKNFVKNRGNDLIIFDVGANQGKYVSALISNHVKFEKIYAFEPHPETFKTLTKNISSHSIQNIKCINVALSDESGITTFYDQKGDAGTSHASLYPDIFSDIYHVAKSETTVETVELDHFCANESIRHIDFLKIDVEGAELNVLRGASTFINEDRIKVIQFEFTQLNSVVGVFFKHYWDFLHQRYDIYRLLPHGLLPIKKYSPSACELFGYQNYIAIHK